MTGFNRGDVVLVNFVFSDESGVKHRPGLIISSQTYNEGRDEVIVAAITSRIDRILVGDHLIINWQDAGLLFPSVATGVIRTVRKEMITRKLGTMSSGDLKEIGS
jgi:mRNA interferase MazF